MSGSTILKKVIGVGNSTYQGVLIKKSARCFELEISELKPGTEKKEFKENEQYTVREVKIRPFNDGSFGASEIAEMQKKIDTYLINHTIEQALAELPAKAPGETSTRKIEQELNMLVERWIDESQKVREVPVVRMVNKLDTKKLDTIPFYFRPSGGQIAKSIQNFIKEKF